MSSQIPRPDYGTGYTNIIRLPLTAQEMPYYRSLVMATSPQVFALPWGSLHGNIILEDGHHTPTYAPHWTVAYGRFRTTQQTQWYVALIYNHPNNGGHRVVGRIYFENFSLPHSGDYLRESMAYSIDRTGTTIQLHREHEIVERYDEGLF